MTVRDPEVKVPMILDMVFPQAWLDAKATDDPQGRTNRELQTKVKVSSVQYYTTDSLLRNIFTA